MGTILMKIFGVFDLFCSLSILYPILPEPVIVKLGSLLTLKGLVFAMTTADVASIIDIFCGIYIVAFAFGYVFSPISFIVIIYLVQKGLFSLV